MRERMETAGRKPAGKTVSMPCRTSHSSKGQVARERRDHAQRPPHPQGAAGKGAASDQQDLRWMAGGATRTRHQAPGMRKGASARCGRDLEHEPWHRRQTGQRRHRWHARDIAAGITLAAMAFADDLRRGVSVGVMVAMRDRDRRIPNDAKRLDRRRARRMDRKCQLRPQQRERGEQRDAQSSAA